MPLIPLTHRARAVLSLVTTVSTATALFRSQQLRSTLRAIFSAREHPYRLAALVTALLLNSKALPLMWHVRFFLTMIYQLHFQPSPLPKDALFRPVVLKGCYTTLMDCDYNLHKSNSTYFADLDIGRTQLISALLRKGILETRGGAKARARAVAHYKDRLENGKAESNGESQMPTLDSVVDSKYPFLIALGGVMTNFKRELKPYETFDIWTRVLAWDRKWVYVVQHMVKPDTVAPEDMLAQGCWAMQPWKEASSAPRGFFSRLFHSKRNSKSRKPATKPADSPNSNAAPNQDTDTFAAKRTAWQKAIYATSISKYVIKKGRLTIPAEEVLIHNDLVPLRPSSNSETTTSTSDTATTQSDSESAKWVWTWENIERERQRGLNLAAQFGALDSLVDEFPGAPNAPFIGDYQNTEHVRVLGAWPDVVW